jgi:hypothetical protein
MTSRQNLEDKRFGKKKLSIKEIAVMLAAIVTALSIITGSFGFTVKVAETFIDERIDKKMDYTVILLQKIATPEQKKAADEEYSRKWKGQ